MSNDIYVVSSDNMPTGGASVSNFETNIIFSLGNNTGYTEINSLNFVGNEFIYTIIGNAYIEIYKTVDSVKLNNLDSKAIPGSTLTYKVIITNSPIDDAGFNVIVFDKIPNNTIYKTNTISGITNFLFEWSTNINPGQNFNSTNYFTNTLTDGIKDKVKWIRWKIATYGINSMSEILYKVIEK